MTTIKQKLRIKSLLLCASILVMPASWATTGGDSSSGGDVRCREFLNLAGKITSVH